MAWGHAKNYKAWYNDIALYILSWMFNKHVFVHNSKYGWCTMPYRTEDNHQDIVDKCDLELLFLKCWAFGEVKKIWGPTRTSLTNIEDKDSTPASKAVIPSSVASLNVIPCNARRRSTRASKQIMPAPPKKVTQSTSSRKHQAVDYSKLDDGLGIPSPPPANDANLNCSKNRVRWSWQPTKNRGRCHPWELWRVQQKWLQRVWPQLHRAVVPVLQLANKLGLSWSLWVQMNQKWPSQLCYHLEVTFLSLMRMLPQKMRNLCPLIWIRWISLTTPSQLHQHQVLGQKPNLSNHQHRSRCTEGL